MTAHVDLERSRTFIQCQLGEPAPAIPPHRKLTVTVSREAGTGGVTIARELAGYLQLRAPDPQRAWTVFDKNIVERVLAEHNLPKEIARYMSEDRISFLDDIVEECFGLHPSAWTLVEKTSQTILRLADNGNVIIVGRGASILTQKLPHVFHVRLIGSLERRIERFSRREGMDALAARDIILKTDQARARYLQHYLHQRIDHPLLYDLVLNTDRLSDALAARLIGEAALSLLDLRADQTPSAAQSAAA